MKRASHREAGQAAVESALTLPLTVFLILGVLQLFQILQARVLAEYAVFRAVRVGSTNHARCGPMMDAALLVLLPSFRTFVSGDYHQGTGAGSPAERLATEFRKHGPANGYRYDGVQYTAGGGALTFSRSIMLMQREFSIPVDPARELEFDQPGPPQRLRTTLVFWYPMRIPFANWVISKMVLGYAAVNPLMPTQRAAWGGTNLGGWGAAVAARAAAGEYVLPVVAEYSMRMMSPVDDGSTSCGSL